MKEHVELRAVDRQEMSILGLMIERMIARSLTQPKMQRRARRICGNLGVRAGRMSLTIAFARDSILVSRGLKEPLRACVKGSLFNLLQVSVSRRPFRAFLRGQISFSGNPLFALKALPFFYGSAERE